jgi:hypothetical protein
MENKRLYILIRNDLPSLNPGKAMAQAIHAANSFLWKYQDRDDVKKWAGQEGYGVTITLSAIASQIKELMAIAYNSNFPMGKIIDQTYPIVIPADGSILVDESKLSAPMRLSDDRKSVTLYRKELTCAFIFGGKEELKPYLGELETYD